MEKGTSKQLVYFLGGSAVVAGVVLFYLKYRDRMEGKPTKGPNGYVFTELAKDDLALFLSEEGAWRVGLGSWRKISDESFGTVANYAPKSYDRVSTRSRKPQDYSFCASVLKVLKPGGKITVQGPRALADELRNSLLFAGFERLSCKIFLSTEVFMDGLAEVSGYAPAAPIKAAKLNLRKKKKAKKEEIKKIWTLAADDLDGGELEDEDALLDNEAEPVEVKATTFDDCEIGKAVGRKPCKDCTCGRKEEWEAGPNKEAKDAPKSACGSCHLGDAFRCAGCPSLGLPAYSPDEAKVVTTASGAVKLQLLDDPDL